MATIKCRDCKTQVTTKDKVCPNCGAYKPYWGQNPKTVKYVFLIGLPAAIALGAYMGENHPPAKEGQKVELYTATAATLCQQEVTSRLISPSTAKFPWDLGVVLEQKRRYEFHSYVDSENAFGAKIRTNWICEAAHSSNNPNEGWKIKVTII